MQVPQTILQTVFEQLEEDRDLILETLAKLVKTPSVVGHEGEAQNLVQTLYRELELDLDVFEAGDVQGLYDHPAYCGWEGLPPGKRYDGRPNVVGTLPGDDSHPSLILNGHIDVVSPEPEGQWSHPPWGAEIQDGLMYGRGASDMKSGLVSAWAALRAILKTGHRPAGTVALQSVIEEEAGGGGGTLACFLRGHNADAFVAVEPSGHRIRTGNGGILYFRIKVAGQTAHAGNAHLGVNAVAEMAPIVAALFELDRRRGREVTDPFFEEGSMGRSCHLSIGTYRAGDWPSTVAGWAEVEARIGFLPGEAREDIKNLVQNTVHTAAGDSSWLVEHPPEVEWFGWKADPWVEDGDHPFIQHMQNTAEKVLGQNVPLYARTSGVDSRFAHLFDSVGVCYGPTGRNNHGIDEGVELESVFECSRVLAALILSWCGWRQRP